MKYLSLAIAGEAGQRGQSNMFDNAGLSRQLRPYLQDTVYSYCNKRRSQAGTELEAFSLLDSFHSPGRYYKAGTI